MRILGRDLAGALDVSYTGVNMVHVHDMLYLYIGCKVRSNL